MVSAEAAPPISVAAVSVFAVVSDTDATDGDAAAESVTLPEAVELSCTFADIELSCPIGL
jgi:hypothetical protein